MNLLRVLNRRMAVRADQEISENVTDRAVALTLPRQPKPAHQLVDLRRRTRKCQPFSSASKTLA
jgi:hypothetical protein